MLSDFTVKDFLLIKIESRKKNILSFIKSQELTVKERDVEKSFQTYCNTLQMKKGQKGRQIIQKLDLKFSKLQTPKIIKFGSISHKDKQYLIKINIQPKSQILIVKYTLNSPHQII